MQGTPGLMNISRFRNSAKFGVLTLAVLACSVAGCKSRSKSESAKALICHVGGTMRPAMEELARRYEAQAGQSIQIDYAGSGELLAKIELTGKGDLYVAHDPFPAALMKKGLGDRGWTVAALEPVIVVREGNPKDIQGFRDLAKPGVKLILSHPEYSTTGHIVARMASKTRLTEQIASNVVTRTRGGGAAANAVSIGTADAAIVWNAVAHLRRNKLDVVPIERTIRLRKDVDAVTSATFGIIEMDYVRVTIATLKSSENLQAAGAFAEFVASQENQKVWAGFGFSDVIPSRPHPALRAGPPGVLFVHCAAGMRLPVRAMADAFEKRRGVHVQLSYDGSNRLLGQIKLTQKGDIYIAGDADYIEMAAEAGLVASSGTICYFVPVIMIHKGNPKNLRDLPDLTKPGLRIGQGDGKAAAVGRLMPRLLELNGVDRQAWSRNVVMETSTVNELGIGIKLGTLDAVVVWDAIAARYGDVAEVILLDPDRNICPAVGAAVLTTAKNPAAAQAFLEFMTSRTGREILKTNGYTVDKP